MLTQCRGRVRLPSGATVLPMLLLVTLAGSGATQSLHAQSRSVRPSAVPVTETAHRRAAEHHIERKEFAEAEHVYRTWLHERPASRDARFGLAQVLSWQAEYRAAIEQFDALLQRNENDHAARRGRADAYYWSGDYRRALKEYEHLRSSGHGDDGVLRSLQEIRSAAAPLFRFESRAVSDDQPYGLLLLDAAGTIFIDPLTSIRAGGGMYRYHDSEIGRQDVLPFAHVTGEVVLPRSRTTLTGAARLQQFGDGTTRLLPTASASWRYAERKRLRFTIAQHELFSTASSARSHPYVTETSIDWDLQSESALAAIAIRGRNYFDGNSGTGADGYLLRRILARHAWTISGGGSLSFRDTTETRFRLDSISATPRATGVFDYDYEGVFDPYHTPREQLEARLIAAARYSAGRYALQLQVDGGFGTEQATSFGARSGATPEPVLATASFDRTYAPWRFEMTFRRAATANLDVTLRYAHSSGSFYESDELQASLVGRF